MSVVQSRAKPGQRVWNLVINAELHKAVKVRAAIEGVSMSEVMHAILCREFERPDLMVATEGVIS